ncbi:uncharacterized protein F5891DRAFT_709661 [Suillus fuscotomentosus]|uniref:Uncharacterized protein n=1 Tax=Suillus fuscotomentosus TaxID=1912939 RepID=A0AAD4HGM6_9AGAM|nr:uncharacterized protein F5891DRAFT_709661 [Suillus fuscotomentosus]KAG1894764.1 hypothetical protein F5891DRAFT_709661 [Suillus fuscotomentosus]
MPAGVSLHSGLAGKYHEAHTDMSSLSISDLTKLQTVKYANLGSLAILVRWTWFRPWDVIRVIFVISRYLPFAGVGMTAYDALRISDKCASTLEGNIIHIIGIVAAEALLIIRTWAFWQKSKRLLIGLLVYSVLTIVAVLAVDLSPTVLIPGEEPPLGTCYFESTRNGAVAYMFLAMFESVILTLTVYKRVHDYKNFESGIVVTLYHDGMVYMLCILGITLANVIIGAALPSAYSNMLDTLQLVIHSVLASRILFRLRHTNERVHEPSMSVTTMESAHYLRPPSMSMSGTATTSQV